MIWSVIVMGSTFDPRCHIGETHGIYTIVDVLDEKDKYGHYIYKAVCGVCGCVKFSHYGAFSGPLSMVHNCEHIKFDGTIRTKTYNWENKRLRSIYSGMVDRCYNHNSNDYQWYGGKGIRICDEWVSEPKLFEEWALNNGYNDNLTIDRVESDKDYCPENCQWISVKENSRKAGNVNWIEVDGVVLTGRQWSERFGIGINIINTVVRRYGINKAKELISAMLQEHPSTKSRKYNQSWLSVYNIQT